MNDAIDITAPQRKTILSVLSRFLPDAEVWVYGSRANWSSRPGSDLDMVVFSTPEQPRRVSDLKDAFEESSLPFRVDLFVWDEIPDSFKANIQAEHVVLQRAKDKTHLFEDAGWVEGSLSDVVVVEMGQSPPGATCNANGNGTPLLNGPTEFGSHHPTPAQWTTDPRKMARAGDILFCVRGSTTGRMNWADYDYAIGRGLAAVRHKEGFDYQPFIRGLIESKLPYLLASATGSTFPNVSRPQLLELPCDIPPLPEQKAIAHILGTLDDKIELNRRMNETLEGIARTIFKSWFVDFDPVRAKAEGRDTGLPNEIDEFFPDGLEVSELGEIPKGWEIGAVGDLGDVVCGKTPPTREPLNYGDDVPFVTIPDMHGKTYVTCTCKRLSNRGAATQKNKFLPKNSICVSCIVTPGLVVLTAEDAQTNQQINSVLPRIENSSFFCYSTLCRLGTQIRSGGSGGSVYSNLSKSRFSTIRVVLPPQKVIQTFDTHVAGCFADILLNQREADELDRLRHLLLPSLLSGNLRVRNCTDKGSPTA